MISSGTSFQSTCCEDSSFKKHFYYGVISKDQEHGCGDRTNILLHTFSPQGGEELNAIPGKGSFLVSSPIQDRGLVPRTKDKKAKRLLCFLARGGIQLSSVPGKPIPS